MQGQSIEVRLRLYELCLGTSCGEGLTCAPVDGRPECVDARMIETAIDGGVDSDRLDSDRVDTETTDVPDSSPCPGTQTSCNGECVDIANNEAHCGRCDRVCTEGLLCQQGECQVPAECDVNNPNSCTGLTYCNPNNNQCARGCDPRLTNQCLDNQTCSANQCVCADSFHECGGVCVSNASVNSCGTSCTPCALAPNAVTMACNGTSCSVSSCASGYVPSADQLGCDEVNECIAGNGGCSVFASCTNLPLGSRTCTCNPGYSGNGLTCTPISFTDWQVDAFIKASNTSADDRFGTSVSLSDDGNTMAIGAYWEDSSVTGINGTPNEGSSNSGAVYVFTRIGNVWSQQAFVKASNPGSEDAFGYAVSLSADGNTLAVSAFSEDTSGAGVNPTPNESASGSGAVYVFTRLGTNWSQHAFIKASNPGADDRFGFALDLSADGNTLAVGALREDSNSAGPNENAVDSGAAYVFTRTTDSWVQRAYLKASNAGAGDEFGRSVSLSADGNTLALGAANEDSSVSGVGGTPNSGMTNSGAAYVFTRTGVSWSEQAFIKASNPGGFYWFGYSVSLSGDGNTLAVGARGEDSSTTGVNGAPNQDANTSGAAYIFTRVSATWSQRAFIKASNTGADDEFGSSLSLSPDGSLLAVGAPYEDSSVNGVNGTPNDDASNAGAVYVFVRNGSGWSQQSFIKASNPGSSDQFGWSVSLSSTGLAVAGVFEDSSATGVNGTPNELADGSGAVYTYLRW